MLKKVQITETYTYELEIEVAENEKLEDVVYQTENIRYMDETTFNKVSQNNNFYATFEYEEK